MLVLTKDGSKGEVLAKLYVPDVEGTLRYSIRTHAGIIYTVDAKDCHVVVDPNFEPFVPESYLTPQG